MSGFEFDWVYDVDGNHVDGVWAPEWIGWDAKNMRAVFADTRLTRDGGWEFHTRPGGDNCFERFDDMDDDDLLANVKAEGWDVFAVVTVFDDEADPADYPNSDFETDGYPLVGWAIVGGKLADIRK